MTAHRRCARNRHLVVIQDDDEIPFGIAASLIQALVGEASGERTVSNHGDDFGVFLLENLAQAIRSRRKWRCLLWPVEKLS